MTSTETTKPHDARANVAQVSQPASAPSAPSAVNSHPAPGVGASQCDRILAALQHALPGEWVPMPKLAQAGGCYAVHSRISDLRRRGHDIQHKNDHHTDKATGERTVKSFYRLNPETL